MSQALAAAAAGATSPAESATSSSRRRRTLTVIAVLVVGAVLALRMFVAEPFGIPSSSMEPTLKPGDSVLVDKLAYRDATPRRGDLVVFHEPRTGDVMLKRAIAVGGDTVGIEDGVLVVNGRRPVEPYADPRAIDSVYFGPVEVRPGTVFVLGDNRGDSVDSRSFGAVPASALIGRVLERIWPPGRWGSPR
ncbi:MAG: signal peptidase [Solirubrobacteraceae bacterium]|nr:signal peptidase [Solirubrobacteraceae bacterium]